MEFGKIKEHRLAWQDEKSKYSFSNKRIGFNLVELLKAVVMGVVHHLD